MTPKQLNKARALRLSGHKLKEIARVTGLPYAEVHKGLTGYKQPRAIAAKVLTVEDYGREMLANPPKWWRGSEAELRNLVEANFGKVGA